MPKILVLGASGMLGSAMLRYFHGLEGYEVRGTARSGACLPFLPTDVRPLVIIDVDIESIDSIVRLLDTHRPDVIINCIGLIKQLSSANDSVAAIGMNALLPHRLARLAALVGARFVHISTDCVFSARTGLYAESDPPDATDLYGRSKLLGEVNGTNAITLRTSIIGHELSSAHGLVGWFLAQSGQVKGFTRAVFSGLPTVELARVIHAHVLPQPDLRGLYHVSAAPIAKYDLLTLVKDIYDKDVTIIPDDTLVIDRSLISSRFRSETGYSPPDWRDLITTMHRFG